MTNLSQPQPTPLGGDVTRGAGNPNQEAPTPLAPEPIVTPDAAPPDTDTTSSRTTGDYEDPQTSAGPDSAPPSNPAIQE